MEKVESKSKLQNKGSRQPDLTESGIKRPTSQRVVNGEGGVKEHAAGLGGQTTRSSRVSKKPSCYIEHF